MTSTKLITLLTTAAAKPNSGGGLLGALALRLLHFAARPVRPRGQRSMDRQSHQLAAYQPYFIAATLAFSGTAIG